MLSDIKGRFQQDGTQAIATAAASDDHIDLGNAYQNPGLGQQLKVATTILTTFTTAASATKCKISIEACTDGDGLFTPAHTVGEVTALIGEMVKGRVFECSFSPGQYRYFRMYYTPDDAFNAGALVSDIVFESPQDKQYPDARSF